MSRVAVMLDREELHLLVTWGYVVRGLSAEEFSRFRQQELHDKLRALRDERLVLGQP